MFTLKYILLISSFFFFAGCTTRTITDYDNCVPAGLTIEFKDAIGISIIDDSEGKNKYSSMSFPKGEYYLCVKEENGCLYFSGQYYEGWNIDHLKSKTIQLTGKYKTNKPNGISSAFTPDTVALQVLIDGRKAWISEMDIDEADVKESSIKVVREVRKNSSSPEELVSEFKCPNTDVKEIGKEILYNRMF